MKHVHKKTTPQRASDKEYDITDRKRIVNLLRFAHFPRKWSTSLAYVQRSHTEFYLYRNVHAKYVDRNLFTAVNIDLDWAEFSLRKCVKNWRKCRLNVIYAFKWSVDFIAPTTVELTMAEVYYELFTLNRSRKFGITSGNAFVSLDKVRFNCTDFHGTCNFCVTCGSVLYRLSTHQEIW
jgi:hypothetical protein